MTEAVSSTELTHRQYGLLFDLHRSGAIQAHLEGRGYAPRRKKDPSVIQVAQYMDELVTSDPRDIPRAEKLRLLSEKFQVEDSYWQRKFEGRFGAYVAAVATLAAAGFTGLKFWERSVENEYATLREEYTERAVSSAISMVNDVEQQAFAMTEASPEAQLANVRLDVLNEGCLHGEELCKGVAFEYTSWTELLSAFLGQFSEELDQAAEYARQAGVDNLTYGGLHVDVVDGSESIHHLHFSVEQLLSHPSDAPLIRDRIAEVVGTYTPKLEDVRQTLSHLDTAESLLLPILVGTISGACLQVFSYYRAHKRAKKSQEVLANNPHFQAELAEKDAISS